MNDFSQRIATFSPEKRELLALRLKKSGTQFNSLPLSFAQQRLWFLEQLDPGNSAYNIPLALRLRGRLNIAALGEALSEVVRRHEVLRTTFPSIDGGPVQVITEATRLPLPEIELGHLGGAAQAEQAGLLVAAEAERGFDLAVGPLFRATLLRLSEQEHVALISMHHIVSDGWSMSVLLREVSALYAAFARGEGSPLAELPLQYADYAAWQRTWLSGARLEQELSYWKKQLGGARAAMELPTDHRRPAVQTFQGGVQGLGLTAALTGALNRWSEQQGVTLFMTLLAAFQVLLSRYTGAAEVVVGTAVANRNRLEAEGLIGFFVNTLVLRTEVDGDENFGELVQRVKEVALGAYSHQELPFEKLVEELEPERSLSHTPLFQVMFGLQNLPTEEVGLVELELSPFQSGGGSTAKFDLSLGLVEAEGRLSGAFEYNRDLFEGATIKRMAGHLEQLLQSLIEQPQQVVSQLGLLTAAEEQQLLVEWNQTAAAYPERRLHEMFEAQVGRTPAALALVHEGEEL